MRRLLLGLACAALLLPAAATAGGFATVQLSSLPDGTDAGGTWAPTMTILQHGVTPLDALYPVVRISDGAGRLEEYPATPTGKPGEYLAEVRFPTAGRWSWEIWDGFTQTHTYSPVTIGEGVSGFPTLPVVSAALGVFGVAGLVLVTARRRRPGPRPALGG
jgi:hypothetical protein